MCGRYALGISIENLPQKFNETVLHLDESLGSLGGSENENQSDFLLDTHYETTSSIDGTSHTIQLNVSFSEFDASYNIPPTGTGVIIYMDKPSETATKTCDFSYRIESLKFGLLPIWAKPQDSLRVQKSTKNVQGAEYSREVQQHQAKLFNCRKETLAQPRTVWATPRKHTRCVVPILGYFEWLNSKQGKIPYYVHLPKSPILFLAGLYSHNYNYNETEIVPPGAKYFSSFSIVTGPATGQGKNDMLWLHSRKPIFLEPNSKAWFDWLRPDDHWDEKMLDTCLDTNKNPVYEELSWYKVAKSMGNPVNKGPDVIKEEKLKQQSISSFFQVKKGPKKEEKEWSEHDEKDTVKRRRGSSTDEDEDIKRMKKES